MKLVLFLFVILASTGALAQEQIDSKQIKKLPPDYLLLSHPKAPTTLPPVKKGKITFADGSISSFTKLRCFGDSICFFDQNSALTKVSLSNVMQVTEYKSKVGISTIEGGLGGFFVGIIAGGLIHPERTFWEFLGDRIDSNDEVIITKKQVPFIIGGTIVGAAIGALVGSSKSTERTVYLKDVSFNFYPEMNNLPDQNSGVMLTCRITFH
jgi:hypothetical protein